MANKKISELTALTALAADDDFIVRDDSEASVEKTKKVDFTTLQTDVLSHATELPVTIGGAVQVNFLDGQILPETDDDINLGDATHQFKRVFVERNVTVNSVVQGNDTTEALNTKILEIGDWNMDANVSANVAHGLTMNKIRGVSVLIQPDGENALWPVPTGGLLGTYTELDAYYYVNASYVNIYRRSGGGFDNTGYDSTGFNRGWVTIWYVN